MSNSDNKIIKYPVIDHITIRIKSVHNWFKENITKILNPWIEPIFKPIFKKLNVSFAICENCVKNGKSYFIDGIKWQVNYLLFNLEILALNKLATFLPSFPIFNFIKKTLYLFGGAIIQGNDDCKIQNEIFKYYRVSSYITGAANAALCKFVDNRLTTNTLKGLNYIGMPKQVNPYISAGLFVFNSFLSSSYMCMFEKFVYGAVFTTDKCWNDVKILPTDKADIPYITTSSKNNDTQKYKEQQKTWDQIINDSPKLLQKILLGGSNKVYLTR